MTTQQLGLFGQQQSTALAIRTKTVDVEAEFEKFWEAYPSRTGYCNPKKTAKKAFTRLVILGVGHAKIITAAAHFAEIKRGTNPKFIPMAATWLNQERFETDYTLPTNGGGGNFSYADLADMLSD